LSRRRRRDAGDQLSLSFLDCICCGFGAIILLLVLTKIGEPRALEQSKQDLEALVARLQEELFEIRGETNVLNRDLTAKQEQLSTERARIARLAGDFSKIQGELMASRQSSEVAGIVEGRLLAAQQELSEEMKRLLALSQQRRRAPEAPVGGIPIDSEYIIFIIDTSGSMQRYAWPAVLQKMTQTLDAYPRVKGIQVMNDMGQYMYSRYAGQWIPDTPARRRAILRRLRGWEPFSNSSPVEGIERAIRTYAAPDKKISLYVFGDEFTGPSISAVVDEVDSVNQKGANGERPVRIHAIGFPVMFGPIGAPDRTGERFASLMRVLCERNGGTFVALNTTSP